MKNKYSKQLNLQTSIQQKNIQIQQVYSKLKKNFNEEATKIKMNYSKQLFDDKLLTTVNKKTLPKLQFQNKKKIDRKKFYSNKLIVNQSIYIHQRQQILNHDSYYQFKKLSIPSPILYSEQSILSERSRRLLSLFKRASMNSISSKQKKTHNKHTNNSQQNHLQTQLLQQSKQSSKVIEILKVAKQKEQKIILPQVKTKNNIIINSIQIQQSQNIVKSSKKSLKKKKSLQNLSNVPYKGITFVKKIYNWKKIPLNLKINKIQFLSLIQNYLHIEEIKPITSGFYKAYVGSGNNNTLIKKILKQRGYWCFVDSLEDNPHFVWTQQRCYKYFNKLQRCQQLSYRINTTAQKIQQQIQQTSQVKNFIRIKMNDYIQICQKLLTKKNFIRLMKQIMKKFINGKNINSYIKIKNLIINIYNQINYQKIKIIQSNSVKLHNHVENSSAIGNKKGLLFYLKSYTQLFSQNINQLIPTTFHVKHQQDINQLFQYISQGPWILKPGQSTNRGQGITIHTNRQSLQIQLSKKKKHKGGKQYTYIVQKYIDPLLYHGRKFDIRVWVLWSGRQAWWYRQGYIRTSSKQYTLKNTNKFIHLTNDAIQSQGDNFGKYQPANKLSYNQFQKYLDIQYGYKTFYEVLQKQMKKITQKVFKIANMVMDKKNIKYTFQLFGIDFLIDKNFKVWLIQCNTNPSLQINCSLLARLIPNMLDNVMNLVVDPYFVTPQKKQVKDNQNWNQQKFKFQLLYDGNQDINTKSFLKPQINYDLQDLFTKD